MNIIKGVLVEKLLTMKSAKANAKLPGIINNPELFAYEVAQQMAGMLEGQKAEGGHIARFDINKKEAKKGRKMGHVTELFSKEKIF